ncbi:hypothetical protein [Vibrio rarus]|uniref:hypothetical protein n=1 Tax=Vibrio rarus TaxID=413403 RepID=UPI0021C3D944|nr:hypothetical protein [Vibrio rarus]
MHLFKVTAIVSSLFMLSACGGQTEHVPSANLNAVESTSQSFEFKNDSSLYTALNALYFFSAQDKITPQKINAGITEGIAKWLKPGVFAKQSNTGIQQNLTFDGNHPITSSETGSVTLQLENWHCYDSSPITVVLDNQGMTIDGTLSEYQYSSGCRTSNTHVFSYNFKHAHINTQFIIDSGSITDLTHQQTLKANQILLTSMADGIKQQFGSAWLAQWQLGAQHAGNDFVTLAGNRVKYQHIPAEMVDFNTLDRSKLLAGTVFGNTPGGAVASDKWCRIINIPQGTDLDSQKAQTMIAVNCARSEKRYCEGIETFLPGMQPATSPLAWSDQEYKFAMDNTNLQQQNNKQGHFEQHHQTQNAFSVSPLGGAPFTGALKAIYGYMAPKNANPNNPYYNNAGANSFTGHAGHCQNEMADWATTTGLSFKVITANGVRGIDFLTQNFAK